MGSGETVVFDLDGVLSRRDLLTAVVVARLRRRPVAAIGLLPAIARRTASRDPEHRAALGRRLFARAFAGDEVEQFRASATTLGGTFAHWVIPDGAARFRAHRAEGATIAVATASERNVVEGFLAAADLVPDVLLASEIAPRAPVRLASHLVGHAKLAALRSAGVPLESARFYTDSIADLPVARAVGRTVLVNADPRTSRAFGDLEVEHVRW